MSRSRRRCRTTTFRSVDGESPGERVHERMVVTTRRRCVALLVIGVLIVPSRVLVALAGTHLKGIVVDASTAERLARVRLRLDNATNDVGEFTFDDLEPGEHTLVAETVGYRLHTEHVVIVANQTTEVTMALTGDAVRLNESVTVTAGDPFTPVLPASPSETRLG